MTRLIAVDNQNLTADKLRLYVGAQGRVQDDPDASNWKYRAGAVHVFSLNTNDSPKYLRTAELPNIHDDPQGIPWWKAVGALVAVPNDWLLNPVTNPRNVIFIAGLNHTTDTLVAQDRLFAFQDI